MRDAELTHLIIGVAIDIHRNLGPSLLKAVYEECFAKEFTLRNISFERQKPIPLIYKESEAGMWLSPGFLDGSAPRFGD
jgi:GxxExxY protein